MNLERYQGLWLAVALGCTFLLGVLLPGCAGLAAENAGGAAAQPGGEDRVTSVRAFLYYHDKGEFSRQDLLSGYMALWNVIGGEGDAEAPSSAMLVLVSVQRPSGMTRTDARIKLTVRAGTKVLSTQEVSLRPFFSELRTIEVPFLVYAIGCERLEIIATLEERNGASSSLTRIAEFRCGE